MSFDSNRLSHAYIVDASFADTIAMAVVCSARDAKRPCGNCTDCDKASRHIHPDIITVSRLDNKHIISVDQIRALKQDVYILPNEAKQKVYVVNDADSMNINAQNAFLQILEEPPAHAVFILCTENPAALLPTVSSRCIELRSFSECEDADDTPPDELEELACDFVDALAVDNVKLMDCMFRIDKLDRHAFVSFISLTREHVVSALRECSGVGASDKRAVLLQTDSVLTKAGEMLDLNVSSGHIAGFICASMVQDLNKR